MCDSYCVLLSEGPLLEVPVYPIGSADGGAIKNAQYGSGIGHIWLDEVSCEGSEYFLQDCNRDAFGVNDCNHHEDASVICQRE